MVEKGMIMFNLQGNEVNINEIRGGTLYTTIQRTTRVSYDNGRKFETQTFRDNKTFSINDIGILLFFHREDISREANDLCDDRLYKFNSDRIREHREVEFAKIYNDIKKDAPLQIMSQQDKISKISSYYSNKKSMQEEEEFYKTEKVEYFGRIDLDTEFYRKHHEKYLRNHYYDKVYISKSGYHKKDNTTHIVDWRAPIATMFYDNERTNLTSKTYLDVFNATRTLIDKAGNETELFLGNDLNVYHYELMLKRRFTFNPLRYSNLYIAGDDFYSEGTVDPFLMEVIAEKRSDHRISDIIRSIQSNQNKMIRQEHNKSMIVQGCAGSGKTMILLHRLSYLKFNKYIYDLSKVKIITPNNLFNLFISDLSHSLELDEIEHTIIEKYYISLAKRYQADNRVEYRKDSDGKTIKAEEILYNRSAQKYIDDLSKRLLPTDGQIDSASCDQYYSQNTILEIKTEYKNEIISLKHKIDVEDIIAISERFELATHIKEVTVDKEYLEILFRLCDWELQYANDKKIDEADKIDKKIKENKETVKKISKYLDFLNNQNEYFKREIQFSESLRVICQQLLDLKTSLAEYEDTYVVAKRIDEKIAEKKSNINEAEIKLLAVHNQQKKYSEAIKELPFWNFAAKRSIRAKNREETLKLDKLENSFSQIKKESVAAIKELELNFVAVIKKLSSSLITEHTHAHILSNLSKEIDKIKNSIENHYQRLSAEHSFDNAQSVLNNVTIILSARCHSYVNNLLTESEQHEITKVKAIKKELITFINSSYQAIIAYIDGVFDKRADKGIEKEFDELSLLRHAIKIIEKYISACNSSLMLFLKIRNDITDTLEVNEADISKLSDLLKSLQSMLLKSHEINLLQNCKTILYRRGELVTTLFEKVKSNLRKKYSIKCNDNTIFKHDIFILLYIYYLHCGELKSGDKYLFIDEGQDYSYYEFELLHLINGNQTYFNVFGDLNQLLLVHRGITDWKQLISMLNANYYELNENYRNTVEITEFCNSKFNYKHTPIGIRGPGVEKITTNQILDAIKLEKGNDHKTRTAVISNDSYSELFELIKRAYPSDDSILIGNVKEVKGLEFDVVFVIVNKMSKSELYISYTRALNHLYIVES